MVGVVFNRANSIVFLGLYKGVCLWGDAMGIAYAREFEPGQSLSVIEELNIGFLGVHHYSIVLGRIF